MKITRAVQVFTDINSPEYDTEEKAISIFKVMEMPTHNGITKAQMLEVIKWLWHEGWEFKAGEQE